jgi:alpha-glucoside transport system permease protein
MYRLAFIEVEFGKSAVVAIVLMICLLPIMIWNIRQANADGKGGH